MRWNVVLALVLATAPLGLRAAESAVLDEKDIWNLYTTPQIAITEIGGSRSVLGGVGLGGVLNDQWHLGIATRFQVNDLTADEGHVSLSTWDYWDVGAEYGYIFSPAKLVHFDASLFAGAGRIQRERGDENKSDFLVVEPSVAACLNLHQTWELGLRAGWRYTDGFGIGHLDDQDLREPIFTFFVRATQF